MIFTFFFFKKKKKNHVRIKNRPKNYMHFEHMLI